MPRFGQQLPFVVAKAAGATFALVVAIVAAAAAATWAAAAAGEESRMSSFYLSFGGKLF